jgi:hypothetical protein
MSRPLPIATVALSVVLLVIASVAQSAAVTASGGSASLEGCRERFVIAPGDEKGIRARVPAEFELARDAAGSPLLYVTAIRCDRYVLGGRSAPTAAAAFAAMIKSPDGIGCASRWPIVGDIKGDALSCNLYVLFAAYDTPDVVSWLRAGTPDLPVHHVRDLKFREGDFDVARLGAALQFHAGRPTPSPFEMSAIVRERLVQTPFTATFWAKAAAGIVRIRFESLDLSLGEAQGTLRAAPGSEMARLLGTETPTGAQPFTMIAGNRWRAGTLTKTVVK